MTEAGTEPRDPNTRLRDARLRLRSPSGRAMSRQELAEAVNGYLWNTHSRRAALDGNYVGKLERGRHRWPQAIYREAFRAVLGAGTDAEIGFYINRGSGTAIDGDLVAQPPPPHQELDTHRPQLTAALDSGALLRPTSREGRARVAATDTRRLRPR